MVQLHRFFRVIVLALGFCFLYAPILSLIIYSFNASELLTVWTHFSLKWYGALAHDKELLQAAWRSLQIAAITASASMAIGTWTGFVLGRMGRFPGYTLYTAMITAPLVLPEVIQGIALLLLFIELNRWFGWPSGRGIFMICIGHLTLCTSYVAMIVQSRVRELSRTLEEAALDLGATPSRVFFSITLPLISHTLIAAWLLSFTLSIDNLVLSAFLSGPGSTTLPLVIFSRARLGLNPEINALATLLIIIITLTVGVMHWIMKRGARRSAQH